MALESAAFARKRPPHDALRKFIALIGSFRKESLERRIANAVMHTLCGAFAVNRVSPSLKEFDL